MNGEKWSQKDERFKWAHERIEHMTLIFEDSLVKIKRFLRHEFFWRPTFVGGIDEKWFGVFASPVHCRYL